MTALYSQLETLSKILPPSFSLTPTYVLPLHPKSRIPSSSSFNKLPASNQHLLGLGVPSSSASKLPSSISMESLDVSNVWEDASESRISELKALVAKGEQERVSSSVCRSLSSYSSSFRLRSPQVNLLLELRVLLFSLLDILPEVDLSVPLPFPLPSPVDSRPTTPLSPSPSRPPAPQSEEEKVYYTVVERLVEWAETLPEEVDPRELEEGGLDGVEPTVGLMDWVEGTTEKVSISLLKLSDWKKDATSKQCETEASHLFPADPRSQSSPRVPDPADLRRSRASLVSSQRRLTAHRRICRAEPRVLRGDRHERESAAFLPSRFVRSDLTRSVLCFDSKYQAELSRMLELKVQFMEVFVVGVRKEIVELQNELMFGDEEREDFAAFWDSESTLNLLDCFPLDC